MLEWVRLDNGQQILDDMIKHQNLKPLDGFSGYYYADIYYPGNQTDLLAKQIYWVQDGFMLDLLIPMPVFSNNLIQDAVNVNIKSNIN